MTAELVGKEGQFPERTPVQNTEKIHSHSWSADTPLTPKVSPRALLKTSAVKQVIGRISSVGVTGTRTERGIKRYEIAPNKNPTITNLNRLLVTGYRTMVVHEEQHLSKGFICTKSRVVHNTNLVPSVGRSVFAHRMSHWTHQIAQIRYQP
jgi:hypothetical protein